MVLSEIFGVFLNCCLSLPHHSFSQPTNKYVPSYDSYLIITQSSFFFLVGYYYNIIKSTVVVLCATVVYILSLSLVYMPKCLSKPFSWEYENWKRGRISLPKTTKEEKERKNLSNDESSRRFIGFQILTWLEGWGKCEEENQFSSRRVAEKYHILDLKMDPFHREATKWEREKGRETYRALSAT